MSTRVATGNPQGQGLNYDPLTECTRIFLRFLQLVFGGFEKGNYHFSPDEKLTDLTISDQATIGKEVVMRRPAILTALGASNFGNTSMNQLAGPLVGYKDKNTIQKVKLNVDPMSGEERHTDLVAGTMVYNCLSKEGIEAKRLAWACAHFTRALKKSLLKAGLHRVGEDLGIGAESAPGTIVQPDTNEIILVSVSVPFFFQDTYTIGPKYNQLLTEVSLALTSGISSPDPENPNLIQPSIYGQPLQVSTLVSMDSKVLKR